MKINNFRIYANRKKLMIIIVSSIFFAIFAHGFVITNELSFHDNSNLFNIGATYDFGRWALGIFGWATNYFTGSSHYSLPLFNGILNIIFISIFSYLVIEILEIENYVNIILISALMISYPMVASAFGYNFTAPYYFFGIMLGGIGIYAFNRYKNIISFIVAIVLIATSIAFYQANLPVCVCLLVALLIKEVNKINDSWKEYFIKIGQYVSLSALGLFVYVIVDKLLKNIFSVEIVDYKNVNNYGLTSVSGYINRIIVAYKEFFNPTNYVSRNMYPFSLIQFYRIFIILFAVIILIYLYNQYKKSIKKLIQSVIILIIIPMTVNLIYIMCDVSSIDSLMMYGQAFIFVYFIMFLSYIKIDIKIIKESIILFAYVLIIVFTVSYIRFDNIAYLKGYHLQSQAKSYFTTLASQIKNCDGYYEGINVVYIDELNKVDSSIPIIEEFDAIYIHPYNVPSLVNDYKWKTFMNRWCGFAPNTIDEKDFKNLPEVISMPCYPNSGSIKIVNDTVVVKFGK